jgi:putative ABC transport system permease protein
MPVPPLHSIGLDARLALRRIGKEPGFAASVITSLGLAIGASAVAFSILDAVRLRSLPLPGSDRLVVLSEVQLDPDGKAAGRTGCRSGCSVSYSAYSQILAGRTFRTLSALAPFASGGKSLTLKDDTQTILGTVTSNTLFEMLDVHPVAGRLFSAEDNRLGAPPVAVLGYGLWTSQFAQDPSLIGTPIQLSDTRYTVIGIMPNGFDFEFGSQFWLPETPALDPTTRPSITSVAVLGRLAAGASLEQVRAELASIDLNSVRRPEGAAADKRFLITAEPLRSRYVAGTKGHDLLFVVIVACVLMIACANVTNLLLARAVGERRAFSIRTALGAGSLHLARLILVEHLVLVIAGALLGIVIAWLSLPLVASVDVLNSPRLTEMTYRLDLRVAAFAVAIATLIAVAISAVPTLLVLRADVQPVLREHGAGTADGRHGALAQRAFVVAQLACAVALVVIGGLSTRRVLDASRMSLGFDATRIVQTTPSLPHDWRVKEKYLPLTERILADLRTLPGVTSASARAFVPLNAQTATPSGSAAPLTPRLLPASIVGVDPEYFATMQIPLIRGRTFTTADRERAAPVAIVNQWAAQRWWAGRDPVGETLRITLSSGAESTLTIVGVVADNKAGQSSLLLADDGPLLYRPYEQVPSPFVSYFVRARDNPASLVRPVQQDVARLVPNRPLSTQVVGDVIAQQLGGPEEHRGAVDGRRRHWTLSRADGRARSACVQREPSHEGARHPASAGGDDGRRARARAERCRPPRGNRRGRRTRRRLDRDALDWRGDRACGFREFDGVRGRRVSDCRRRARVRLDSGTPCRARVAARGPQELSWHCRLQIANCRLVVWQLTIGYATTEDY